MWWNVVTEVRLNKPVEQVSFYTCQLFSQFLIFRYSVCFYTWIDWGDDVLKHFFFWLKSTRILLLSVVVMMLPHNTKCDQQVWGSDARLQGKPCEGVRFVPLYNSAVWTPNNSRKICKLIRKKSEVRYTIDWQKILMVGDSLYCCCLYYMLLTTMNNDTLAIFSSVFPFWMKRIKGSGACLQALLITVKQLYKLIVWAWSWSVHAWSRNPSNIGKNNIHSVLVLLAMSCWHLIINTVQLISITTWQCVCHVVAWKMVVKVRVAVGMDTEVREPCLTHTRITRMNGQCQK